VIPGLQSKLSESQLTTATTIVVLSDIVFIAGTTAVATIVPPQQGGFSTVIFVVATDAAGFSTVTTGNIALAVALTTNKVTAFIFSKKNAKWYPGAIS
jgi:hypothetical protein